ncbi:hypothetical protein [Serratia bockelmannii]|uniref:hypothetical protein n=1 Tax=Serratia bockelmannii TaxID=2703793 RepID=UPI003FA6C957
MHKFKRPSGVKLSSPQQADQDLTTENKQKPINMDEILKIKYDQSSKSNVASSDTEKEKIKNDKNTMSHEEKMQYIHENFQHEMAGNIISSYGVNSDSVFTNKYQSNTWEFRNNGRDPAEPIYMSDIVEYQYHRVSKACHFNGMPNTIIRDSVTNEKTLALTEGLSGQELYDTFFQSTVNGKSTKRILDTFNLKALSVMRDDDDFTVTVTPS